MSDTDKMIYCSTIIYQSAEVGAEDTIEPRLVIAGANCSRIAFIDESEKGLTQNDVRIESVIKETGARLMVIDTLQVYLGESSEMNRANGIRPVMKQLTAIADRTGCAFIITGHMNKQAA